MQHINFKELKRELRCKSRKARNAMSGEEKAILNDKIYANVMRLRQYKSCRTMFIYVSSKIEIDTRRIIERAFADGKRVAVPRCTDEKGQMVFHYITSFDQLSPGAYLIDEPDENAPIAACDDSSFMIVPAFLIDRRGYRIGYGKGYYDRYLAAFSGQTVGLCYNGEFVDSLPHGRFDKSVDVIVTPGGIKTVK